MHEGASYELEADPEPELPRAQLALSFEEADAPEIVDAPDPQYELRRLSGPYRVLNERLVLHARSGNMPDAADPVAREIGALLSVAYRGMGVDTILYDGIGENTDPDVPANNTNNNHICVGASDVATFAMLDIANLAGILGGGGLPSEQDIYQPVSPFVPFDCVGFTNGPIEELVLP